MAQEYKNLLRSDSSHKHGLPVRLSSMQRRRLDQYKVHVRWGILDTLDVTTDPVVIGQTVNLLKSNSNKSPFPIVAPDWAEGKVKGYFLAARLKNRRIPLV